MVLKLTDDDRRTIKDMAEELGVTPESLIAEMQEKHDRVEDLRKSPDGKFRVIGIDKYDREDWLDSEYDTAEEALSVAREKTRTCMHLASDAEVATVFYAYDPEGTYLGGDVWNDE